jgi:hypothetical protein
MASARLPALRRYRDLRIYTTSGPDETQPDRIVATTQFVNEGSTRLEIDARLEPNLVLGFEGARYQGSVSPGTRVAWQWSFTAPQDLPKRQVLTGRVDINQKRERDLYVSIQGTDPAGLPEKGIEKIGERARVVATYAPRTQESIEQELAYRKAHQPKAKLILAAQAQTDYCIVMESEPASKAAVLGDLQRVVREQSGADLRVQPTATGPAIILRKIDLGVAVRGLQDAYRLRTDGRDVIIEAPSAEGLRNGIYGLLTDHLGAHWFQPNALGEEIVIPEDRTVRLPTLDEVRGSRWFSCSGASWGKSPSWDVRNRSIVNRGRMSFGHNWASFINPNKYPFDKYPEYYARDRQGKIRHRGPGSNFCSTHPEVIKLAAQDLNAYFKNEPGAIVSSIDPNDYAPMCLCDRCLAVDKQYGQMNEDGRAVSDRILHFSREVHDRLDPQFQDRYLGVLVYGFQVELPKSAQPHPRHAGILCDMVWVYDHSRPWNDPTSRLNRHFCDLVKGWGKRLPQFGYYDYYGHWTFPGPWALVHKMREDLPAFRDMGGTYIMLEAQPNFATQGLNHYVLAQLAWNLDVDVDLAVEEFIHRYYGPVAEPMRDYWMTAERFYALERPATNNPPRAALRPEFWAELERCLARASQVAANLPADQKRFADRAKFTADGFNYSRRHFEYQRDHGYYAPELQKPVDHAAAIAYLRNHQAYFAELQHQYSEGDGYWPPIAPRHLVLDVDAEIKTHEAALPKTK